MHRYYCERPLSVNEEATIDGNEAHHLLHVMRADAGQQITLFDGSGAEFVAEVREKSRKSVNVFVSDRSEVDRELGFELTVGSALPKGDRQRFLIEKLVELGVTRFVPLRSDRSVVKPNDSVCDRLRKSVIEASKQCGRNRLMHVESGKRFSEFVADESTSDSVRLIAHPYDAEEGAHERSGNATVLIGPEGGFSDEEVALAKSIGWRPVSLGPRILRIETAAIALAVQLTTVK